MKLSSSYSSKGAKLEVSQLDEQKSLVHMLKGPQNTEDTGNFIILYFSYIFWLHVPPSSFHNNELGSNSEDVSRFKWLYPWSFWIPLLPA